MKYQIRKYHITDLSSLYRICLLTGHNGDDASPFLKDTDYAADKIYDGLVNKKSFEIIFPPQIAFIYKIFQILPNRIYNFLINKFVNR